MTRAQTTQTCWRIFSSGISLAGLVLLILLLDSLADGSLAREMFPKVSGSWLYSAFALTLSLPVPLHVFSIGLILQHRFFSPAWKKVAWVCIVTSGVWLGMALMAKTLLLA